METAIKCRKSLMKAKNISLKSTQIPLFQEAMNVGGKNILKNSRKVVFSDATFLLFLGMDEGRTGCFDSRKMKVR